jgi:outer membrane biosynthesis protein TonB
MPQRVPVRRTIAPTTRAVAPAVEGAAPVEAREESAAVAAGGADAGAAGPGAAAASAGSGGGPRAWAAAATGAVTTGSVPSVRAAPRPTYPGRARRQGWQGTVDVELAIARDGAVAEARIGRSSGSIRRSTRLRSRSRARAASPCRRQRTVFAASYANRFVLDETAARR